MHIYHYAAYEVSAMRRLACRHDTRQEEVDELLRNKAFVDLYQVVRHGLRIGEGDYSLKTLERLYRPKRATQVTNAAESMVQYARWIESRQSRSWKESPILAGIRAYNEDDCLSTAELLGWLRTVASGMAMPAGRRIVSPIIASAPVVSAKALPPEVLRRLKLVDDLRRRTDSVSVVLAEVLDFHRREEKPMWWRLFDRASATVDDLRDDPGCIASVRAVGAPIGEGQSLLQEYQFDPAQECKLAADDIVVFAHNLRARLTITYLDLRFGRLTLKIGRKSLAQKFENEIPAGGSLLADEYVSAKVIQVALSDLGAAQLHASLPLALTALLQRRAPSEVLQRAGESVPDAAIRVAAAMRGGCLVVQGPPGTGKTYAASRVVCSLLAAGKTVGVTSNSHKAIDNLLLACGARARGRSKLRGLKVGGDANSALLSATALKHVENAGDARGAYSEGVVGGTAWLFSRPEWEGTLDYLIIDEAGQVSLANAIAMARCAQNLILVGDQMQLEQPVQGSHPGDAGLSVLQYALKDTAASRPDAPVFHDVVPADYGLFLGESRRMHPSVCRLISESIYEGRLCSHPDCGLQRIATPVSQGLISAESGVVLVGVQHEGNVQQSDEETEMVQRVFADLLGRVYTSKAGDRPLAVDDILVMAPYNAQVRALQAALPAGARVGSIDRFQGQQAPVCVVSMCSSFGEYGSRGLAFILDRNRLNVAISRAQCLAVVVADPRIGCAIPNNVEEMKLLNLFCKISARSAWRISA